MLRNDAKIWCGIRLVSEFWMEFGEQMVADESEKEREWIVKSNELVNTF